jgi:pyruvate dehydrogenase E2 component (dihydrolipoamide acetyltransferase)
MATAVIMPRQGQSVESCILVEWLVAVGDQVSEGQALATIETDKAVFEVESPAAGEILALFGEAGDDIPVLENIAAIGSAGEDVSALSPSGAEAAASESAPAEAASEPAASTAQPASTPAAVPVAAAPTVAAGGAVSPRARMEASKAGVDASALTGTGPNGRIIARDVKAAAASAPRMSAAARAAAEGGMVAPASGTGPGGMVLASDMGATGSAVPVATAPAGEVVEIPVSGIRKIIAERMHASLSTTAQLTMTRSVDATSILGYRAKVKAQAEAMGLPSITINDMVVFALVRTLKEFPELNAHFLGDKIVQFPYVNIGIAVDTPRGLIVPNVKGADTMGLAGISQSIKPMAEAALAGSINPDQLSGGTFTITNLGMLGVETFTPVLNAPEVAILGVGGLTLKPVMKDGEVVHVQSLALSLTVEHQAVDGAPAARFLAALAARLEAFELALA